MIIDKEVGNDEKTGCFIAGWVDICNERAFYCGC